jgi:hypothetical protein
MERQDDADPEHEHDQAVEPGIGEKRGPDLPLEHDDEQRNKDHEHQHPEQEDAGRGQFVIEVAGHGAESMLKSMPRNQRNMA